MGMTLDQLLDETGVNDLAGGRSARRMTKTAAPEKNFSKLAERCRQAINTTPDERTVATQRDLAEKTASVAIVRRTLAEIAAIDGGQTKTAAAAPTAPSVLEAFIKEALAKGHSPAAIATWLEKNSGLVERIGRGLREMKATHGYESAAKAVAKGSSKAEKNLREWQDIARRAEGLQDADKAGLISKLRRRMGDEKAHSILKDRPGYHKMSEFKDLANAVKPSSGGTSGAKRALGVTVGGANVGLTSEQLGKLKAPAAVGAGYLGARALGKRGDNDKKDVVIVDN